MAKIIAVANQKGGVGKTTSVINLASALAGNFTKKKYKVLVIDLDPQANTTTGSGVDKHSLNLSVYDIFLNQALIKDIIIKSPELQYDILAANRNLSGAEIELVTQNNREFVLKTALETIKHDYDVILIDCPPSLSLLTLNGLACAQHIIVPIQCEYYALEGLTDLLSTINKVQAGINPNLDLLGIVRTMYDNRNNLAVQVSNEINKHFANKLFDTCIPRNVRLAEAPSFGKSALVLDSSTRGAKAYVMLANELIHKLNLK